VVLGMLVLGGAIIREHALCSRAIAAVGSERMDLRADVKVPVSRLPRFVELDACP
jgi:hypothetical protein